MLLFTDSFDGRLDRRHYFRIIVKEATAFSSWNATIALGAITFLYIVLHGRYREFVRYFIRIVLLR